MSRRFLILAFTLSLLSLAPPAHAGGKKEEVAKVSFHMEGDAIDNPKMIFQQQAGGRMRVFGRVPTIGSKDILSFTTFPSEDGDYGLLFQLKDSAKQRLSATTNMGQGRFLCAMLNGRVVDAVKIDKPVEDGKLVIWKGATLADVTALDETYPRIGQEGQKKKKKNKD